MSSIYDRERPVPELSSYAAHPVECDDGTMICETLSPKYTQQWTVDQDVYVPTGVTTPVMQPGYYMVCYKERGLSFIKTPLTIDNIFVFPNSLSTQVTNEVKAFWDKEERFRKYGICHKRGILLYGPPGNGKSSILQLVAKDIIERDGVILRFTSVDTINDGLRVFRQIQPNTPVVVFMEDIDAIFNENRPSDVLNLLDGVNKINKVVFLATTNYPERLRENVINRPSRFDKKYKIDKPNVEERRLFLEFLNRKGDLNFDSETWAADTKGFSLSHLKELYVAIAVFETPYAEALETLAEMKNKVSSDDDEETMGFRKYK